MRGKAKICVTILSMVEAGLKFGILKKKKPLDGKTQIRKNGYRQFCRNFFLEYFKILGFFSKTQGLDKIKSLLFRK